MSNSPYFEVEEAFSTGLVTGRNGELEIPVGAVFTSLKKVRFEWPGEERQTIDLSVVAELSLRLDKVEIFRRFLEVVPRRYSAGLYLSGWGIDNVIEALSRRQKGESLSMHFD